MSSRQAAFGADCLLLTIGTLLAATFTVSIAAAQTANADFERRRAQEAEQERLKSLGQMTPQPPPAEAKQPAISSGNAVGSCFDITHVEVEGVKQFSAAAVGRITAPYANRCIGVSDINTLLRDLTHLYLDKGFASARVYVPAQDIAKTKTLRLVAIEGTLGDIYVNGKPAPGSGMIATAFPGMKGQVTNLRDIEQGLDQINRLTFNNAKTAMLPGKSATARRSSISRTNQAIPGIFPLATAISGSSRPDIPRPRPRSATTTSLRSTISGTSATSIVARTIPGRMTAKALATAIPATSACLTATGHSRSTAHGTNTIAPFPAILDHSIPRAIPNKSESAPTG